VHENKCSYLLTLICTEQTADNGNIILNYYK